MTQPGRRLDILHRGLETSAETAKLGPYQIETLISVEMEGAATAYRVTIGPNQITNTSYHQIAEELYYVLAGAGVAYLDNKPFTLKTGDFFRLPPGVTHRFETTDSSLTLLDIHVPGCRTDRDTYFVDQAPSGFGGT
jgi:mannose-6-phosphate isomerase-like protein (cupin superfamily)